MPAIRASRPQSHPLGRAVIPPPAGDPIGRSALRKASLHLLPLIGLGYCIAFMDRVNISFAALQMNRQLHFSATVYGLGAGLFFLSYAACEVPSNLLLMRFGARRWLARIMFTWGLISMGTILVRTPLEFWVARLLLGVAEAGFFPGVVFYLMHWFPASHRSRAVSRFYIALPLASTVTGALAGSLMGLDGRMHLAGWQWLLVAEGLPAVLMSAVFFLALPDSPMKAAWLTGAEREWILARLRDESAARGHGRHGLREAFCDARVWLLGGFFFLLYVAAYGYTFSAPELVQQVTGLSIGPVGFIIAALGVAGALAMLGNAWNSDRTGERFWHIVLPLLCTAAGFVAVGVSVSPLIVLPALVLVVGGFCAVQGPAWTIPPQFLEGRSAAAGIATINMIAILGGFVGPYWMGLSRDATGSLQRGLLTVAAPVLVAVGIATIVLRLGKPQAAAARAFDPEGFAS